MRFAVSAATTLIAIAVACYACSSDPPATPGNPDAGGPLTTGDDDDAPPTTSSSSSSSSGDNSSSSSSSTGGESSSSSSSSGGDIPDAGPPIDGGSAGTLCNATSVKESEPNNTAGAATPLNAVPFNFCGELTPGDTDNFTFTFPDADTGYSFLVSQSGGTVVIDGIVDGTTYHLVPKNAANPKLPLTHGKPTLLTITAAPGAVGNVDYNFNMTVTTN